MRDQATTWMLRIGAILALAAAFVILINAGLPNRAHYSGFVVEGVGRVAPEGGSLAPPFTQATLNGDPVNLLDLRGETVIINFWATWCLPCRVEMPELQEVHEATGVRILAVNIGEGRDAVAQWVAEFGLTFDIVLDPQQRVYQDYRVRGQPSTYIVAPDGIITHIFFGQTTATALHEALEVVSEREVTNGA